MNIPPKYEDVVAKLDAAEFIIRAGERLESHLEKQFDILRIDLEASMLREAALREELETEKRANYNARVALKASSETCELWKGRTTNLTHTNAALQQRLTVAEQLLREIRQSCELSKLRDAQIDAALNPATECEHSFHYFGDYPVRRCNWCNKLEAAEGEGS